MKRRDLLRKLSAAGFVLVRTKSPRVRLLSPRQPNAIWDLAMPLLNGIEPTRLKAIKAALARMTLLQQERVILMMPEVQFGGE